MSENVQNQSENNVMQEHQTTESSYSSKENRKNRFYYSFLTLVLFLCILQIGFGVILNLSKTISNTSKIKTMEHILDNAEAYNTHLKNEIKMFSTDSTLEGIARNNLKMAGEDEVLVIINEKNEEPVSEKEKLSKHKQKDEKNNDKR